MARTSESIGALIVDRVYAMRMRPVVERSWPGCRDRQQVAGEHGHEQQDLDERQVMSVLFIGLFLSLSVMAEFLGEFLARVPRVLELGTSWPCFFTTALPLTHVVQMSSVSVLPCAAALQQGDDDEQDDKPDDQRVDPRGLIVRQLRRAWSWPLRLPRGKLRRRIQVLLAWPVGGRRRARRQRRRERLRGGGRGALPARPSLAR